LISIEIKENETPHLELSLFKDIEIFTMHKGQEQMFVLTYILYTVK